MKKVYISSLVFISLFCLAGFALAIQIPNPLGSTSDFGALLCKIAKAVGGLVATLGTIMLIVAGILYLTSAGSPEKITTAKKALVYAIVGIVIGTIAGALPGIICDILGATCTGC